jgi:fumarate reductase flavoprotein subunit
MVAALAAVGNGASVLLLEKLENVGGNSTLSTGSIPAAGSRFQVAAGIDDNPSLMVADLLEASGPHEAEDLLANMAELSAELVHWLVDTHGGREAVLGMTRFGATPVPVPVPAQAQAPASP